MERITLYTGENGCDQHTVADPAEMLAATGGKFRTCFHDPERMEHLAEFTDVFAMSCTNRKSEDPDEWGTPEAAFAAFQGVQMWLVFDQYHDKASPIGSARPRFHCLFPLNGRRELVDLAFYFRAAMTAFPRFDEEISMNPARTMCGGSDARPPLLMQNGPDTIKTVMERSMKEKPAPDLLILHEHKAMGSGREIILKPDEIQMLTGHAGEGSAILYTAAEPGSPILITESLAEIRAQLQQLGRCP